MATASLQAFSSSYCLCLW